MWWESVGVLDAANDIFELEIEGDGSTLELGCLVSLERGLSLVPDLIALLPGAMPSPPLLQGLLSRDANPPPKPPKQFAPDSLLAAAPPANVVPGDEGIVPAISCEMRPRGKAK